MKPYELFAKYLVLMFIFVCKQRLKYGSPHPSLKYPTLLTQPR